MEDLWRTCEGLVGDKVQTCWRIHPLLHRYFRPVGGVGRCGRWEWGRGRMEGLGFRVWGIGYRV